jgi:hypothetical protein
MPQTTHNTLNLSDKVKTLDLLKVFSGIWAALWEKKKNKYL